MDVTSLSWLVDFLNFIRLVISVAEPFLTQMIFLLPEGNVLYLTLRQAYFLNTTFDLSGSGTLSFCQKSPIYEENFENFTK